MTGVKYFPYVMTLFLFILFANLLGLIPMSFTTTSHVAVTVDAGADGVPGRDGAGLHQARASAF